MDVALIDIIPATKVIVRRITHENIIEESNMNDWTGLVLKMNSEITLNHESFEILFLEPANLVRVVEETEICILNESQESNKIKQESNPLIQICPFYAWDNQRCINVLDSMGYALDETNVVFIPRSLSENINTIENSIVTQ